MHGNRGTAAGTRHLSDSGTARSDRILARRGTRGSTSSSMGMHREGFPAPSRDSKFSSARFKPSKIGQSDLLFLIKHAETIAVGHVHELAPVQVRALPHGG